MAYFLRGWRKERKKIPLGLLENSKLSYEKGGIGMRNLRISNPFSKKWDTENVTQKQMMHNKHKVEKHISWKLNLGNLGLEQTHSTSSNNYLSQHHLDLCTAGHHDQAIRNLSLMNSLLSNTHEARF
ncbi:hypothetical protein H5410_003046 [Solanum commersonii]|uniref:Uncharacterized protein n=1 Tax=Solanum commersonii TaxID=4109 RepID=A0A9J6B3P7_SOLCO|nr:hypothetical protein H5410_003046 [Solanum commersonii]